MNRSKRHRGGEQIGQGALKGFCKQVLPKWADNMHHAGMQILRIKVQAVIEGEGVQCSRKPE